MPFLKKKKKKKKKINDSECIGISKRVILNAVSIMTFLITVKPKGSESKWHF